MVLTVGGACPGLAATNPGLQKIVSGAFGLPFGKIFKSAYVVSHPLLTVKNVISSPCLDAIYCFVTLTSYSCDHSPPVGLMMTLVGGGELFTGNTALVTAAVIEKKATMKDLVKNWFFSYGGNFVGSLFMAYLAYTGGTLGDGGAAVLTANLKVSYPFKTLFVRGVLCNWLVCMAVYMASGCTSLVSKMVAIWFPISAFIALGLDHSIANMFLIPLGIMRGAPITFQQFVTANLIPVTLGNIVGGAGCVAMGYSAAYGSLLDRAPSDASSSKVLNMRGGFIPSSTKVTQTKMNMKIASEYLTPEAWERAKVGNNIEKIKQKKDPTQLWTDVHEFAAAIREGKTNW